MLLVLACPMDQMSALMLAWVRMDQQHQNLTADRPMLLMKAFCLILQPHSQIPAQANDLLSLETVKITKQLPILDRNSSKITTTLIKMFNSV